MTLVDAGPLVALVNPREPQHDRCSTAYDDLQAPLVTTWPAFTESMYLLQRRMEWPGQAALWRLIAQGELELADLTSAMSERAATLMGKYADVPMDLADATLVALAEQRNETRIFTIDSDFEIYRLNGRRRFEIVPD